MNASAAGYIVVFAAFAGCDAEVAAGFLIPETVEVSWDRAFDAASDGLVAVVPFDVYVYDAAGRPVPGVDVELVGDAVGVLDIGEVEVATADCVSCAWDTRSDARVRLLVSPRGAWVVTSDDRGLARCYLVVDRLGVDGGSPRGALSVSALGSTNEVLIVPR